MTPGGSAVVQQTRRRLSRHGASALGAMLVPAVLCPLGLFLLRDHARFAWLGDVRAYPWELWAIAVCGTAATLGGVLDWRFHRCGETVVGRREHRARPAGARGGRSAALRPDGGRLDQPAAGAVPGPCVGGPHLHGGDDLL